MQSLLINLKLETTSTRSAKQRLPLSVGTFLSRYLCLSRSGMLLHLQPITDANERFRHPVTITLAQECDCNIIATS